MLDIFPLTSDDIDRIEGDKWHLQAVIPKTMKIIQEDIASFGISIYQINRMEGEYHVQLVILFRSQEDLNLYKMTGNIKEGKLDVFSDSGLIIFVDIVFTLGTEIYG